MGFLQDADGNLPTIPEFYNDKTIFMTGGSGFMGKVLIEKLLYSCSGLKKIYLLIRSKKDSSPEERLKALFSSQCFNRLRKERPGVFESKVFLIAGDVAELGLGMSEKDRAIVVNETNIMYHVAASVKFDDALAFAVKLNLRGTREVVELAKEVKNLNVLVHVSTSYLNTNRDAIEETMYPPHAEWKEVISVCEKADPGDLKVLTSKYLGILPNTYVFAKQMAEHMVYEERGKLPIVIIRPSVVIGSVSEPMPGWIESFNGPNGVCIGIGKGILRVLYSMPDSALDFVPVDLAIRHFITASWLRGTTKLQETDDIPIYHCCSGDLVRISFQQVVSTGLESKMVYPLDNPLWAINCTVTSSKLLYHFWFLLLHILPALLVDSILWIIGKKPMLFRIQRKIYVANLALEYFMSQRWNFVNSNFIDIRSRIKETDRGEFYYDVEGIDVKEYFETAFYGGRMYLMNGRDEDLPKARTYLWRITVLDRVLKMLLLGYVLWKIVQSNVLVNICNYFF